MSLTKISLAEIVKKQYVYKLRAYHGVFTTLVVLQIIAILFSFNGVSSMGTSTEGIQINVHYYSADIVIIFTILWSFISAMLLTTQAYRDDDFAFVTNRVSSNLANISFLFTASIIGGLTAMLSTFLLKVLLYYLAEVQFIKDSITIASPNEFIIGFFVTVVYVFFFSAIGYLIGTLVQLHGIFAFVLPVVFFGMLFFDNSSGIAILIEWGYKFFAKESLILLFLMKALISIVLLFLSSIILANRLGVRK
ncbi:hypothetical protein ACJ2A9_02865 [Anaerobacillus sp. MEB173]|uniref:hypothetical protein n=1 Tax=Anaerobacillus sp. MEB173 TaxID=3383345 RepID=UPI003F930B8D